LIHDPIPFFVIFGTGTRRLIGAMKPSGHKAETRVTAPRTNATSVSHIEAGILLTFFSGGSLLL